MIRAGFHGRSRLSTAAMMRFFVVVCVIVLCGSAEAAYEAVPGEYVVKLKRPVDMKSTRQLSHLIGAEVIDIVRNNVVLVRSENGGAPSNHIRSLSRNPAVALVEPNYIYRATRMPNDPEIGKLWGLSNGGGVDSAGSRGIQGVDLNAERAWDIQTGSKEILVAIIDTGVDYTHPDLKSNAWVNKAEKNGQPGVDDDGNGLIDDIYGYDFANGDGDPLDDNGHGSHCAGTIGATGDDGTGLVGVNWNVSLMGVKFLDGSGGGTLANAIKAIDYSTKMGVDIMSNSWGGGGPAVLLREAIERARAAGILFVAAAGNSTSDNDVTPEYPATYDLDNIISVAAIDNRGDLADFSSYGATTVHVAAPGVNILSSVPGGVEVLSGTSMATPHVSGVAALLLAHQKDLNFHELRSRLLRSARPLATLTGKTITGGMIDAYYALTDTKPPADPNDPSIWVNKVAQEISSPHPYESNYTQTWTVHVPGAKRFSIHFARFETEKGYDKVQFLNAAGENMGTISGNLNGKFSPIIDGDTIVLKFTSDGTIPGYGFDIDYAVYE